MHWQAPDNWARPARVRVAYGPGQLPGQAATGPRAGAGRSMLQGSWDSGQERSLSAWRHHHYQ
jgi:hypothetical protein